MHSISFHNHITVEQSAKSIHVFSGKAVVRFLDYFFSCHVISNFNAVENSWGKFRQAKLKQLGNINSIEIIFNLLVGWENTVRNEYASKDGRPCFPRNATGIGHLPQELNHGFNSSSFASLAPTSSYRILWNRFSGPTYTRHQYCSPHRPPSESFVCWNHSQGRSSYPKPLHYVHNNQAFRKPIGASGRLDNDLWIKCEYMESKDKYRVTHLHNRSEPNFPDFMPVHLSPRFKVYVQDWTLSERLRLAATWHFWNDSTIYLRLKMNLKLERRASLALLQFAWKLLGTFRWRTSQRNCKVPKIPLRRSLSR